MYDSSISIEDRSEIQELYARYCHFADQCDGENWANCFTRDGFFAPSLGPGSGKDYRGHAALAAFISAPARNPLENRHWNGALTLEREGQFVRAQCYAFLLQVVNVDSPQILGSVTYHDLLVREDGAWKFKERRPTKDDVPRM